MAVRVKRHHGSEDLVKKVRDTFDAFGAMRDMGLWQRRYDFVKYLRRYLESGCEKPIVFATGRVSTSTYDYWLEVRFPCGIGTVDMGVFNPYEGDRNTRLYEALKKILIEHGIEIEEKDYGLKGLI